MTVLTSSVFCRFCSGSIVSHYKFQKVKYCTYFCKYYCAKKSAKCKLILNFCLLFTNRITCLQNEVNKCLKINVANIP